MHSRLAQLVAVYDAYHFVVLGKAWFMTVHTTDKGTNQINFIFGMLFLESTIRCLQKSRSSSKREKEKKKDRKRDRERRSEMASSYSRNLWL